MFRFDAHANAYSDAHANAELHADGAATQPLLHAGALQPGPQPLDGDLPLEL